MQHQRGFARLARSHVRFAPLVGCANDAREMSRPGFFSGDVVREVAVDFMLLVDLVVVVNLRGLVGDASAAQDFKAGPALVVYLSLPSPTVSPPSSARPNARYATIVQGVFKRPRSEAEEQGGFT